MRILGREGDRWFARIDIIGLAAANAGASGTRDRKGHRPHVIRRDEHYARAWSCCPFTCPQAPRRTDMTS